MFRYLTCIIYLLSVLPLNAQVTRTGKKPNMLWITCEDMSPHLSCYGEQMIQTPHLDSLAAEGIRYTNAFTTAGVCAPSRIEERFICFYNNLCNIEKFKGHSLHDAPGLMIRQGFRDRRK